MYFLLIFCIKYQTSYKSIVVFINDVNSYWQSGLTYLLTNWASELNCSFVCLVFCILCRIVNTILRVHSVADAARVTMATHKLVLHVTVLLARVHSLPRLTSQLITFLYNVLLYLFIIWEYWTFVAFSHNSVHEGIYKLACRPIIWQQKWSNVLRSLSYSVLQQQRMMMMVMIIFRGLPFPSLPSFLSPPFFPSFQFPPSLTR